MTAVSNNALDILQEILRTRMNDLADHLAGGGCKDFDEYQHVTGKIEGFAIAERELLDLKKRIERA